VRAVVYTLCTPPAPQYRADMYETEKIEAAEWLRLYGGRRLPVSCGFSLALPEHTEHDSPSLELPSAISAEFARLTAAEAQFKFVPSDSGPVPGFDGGRAELLNAAFAPFFTRFKSISELSFASGGVMLKPVPGGASGIMAEVYLPGDFEITGAEGGCVVSAEFITRCRRGSAWYIRRERHEKTRSGWRITNRYLRATSYADTGHDISHREASETVPEWKGLADSVSVCGLRGPLFSYYRVGTRERSPYGVSVFARAVDLIREADVQFGRLLWEFEGGELAIDASEDAFRLDRSGRPVLPAGRERLFRPNKLDYTYGSSSDPLRTFSPALRDASLINGLNQIIMRIEDAVGLARGTFSDPQQTARTATEIKMMRQRTYAAVRDLQTCARSALEGLARAADDLCTLYGLAPADGVRLICDFGDSVLADSESSRELDLDEVRAGVLSAAEYRARWHADNKGKEAML
jgi:A118 family predicted phage portal protein